MQQIGVNVGPAWASQLNALDWVSLCMGRSLNVLNLVSPASTQSHTVY